MNEKPTAYRGAMERRKSGALLPGRLRGVMKSGVDTARRVMVIPLRKKSSPGNQRSGRLVSNPMHRPLLPSTPSLPTAQ